jgi:hypothetical protein
MYVQKEVVVVDKYLVKELIGCSVYYVNVELSVSTVIGQ